MAGIESTGFVTLTTTELRAAINSALREKFGASIDVSDDSVEGVFAGIVADRLAQLWEGFEAAYNSQNAEAATGAALDALAALTGTIRKAASAGVATIILTGTATTVVPAGSQVRSESVTTTIFGTDANATITAATTWASATAYAVGDYVTHDASGSDAIWVCSVAGTSAGSGGPDETGLAQGATTTDNTVTWRYVGLGNGYISALATCTSTGALDAVAYDLNTIETPVSGWSSALNLTDATPGTAVETDEDLRLRRVDELSSNGETTLGAIRQRMLEVSGVTACTVFQNITNVTDSDGVPPKSVEVMIQGSGYTNQAIFDALLNSVAAGIATHGDITGTAEDEAGIEHAMGFSTPSEQNVYVTVTIEYDADDYPGDAAVKAAIVEYGDAQPVGMDVRASAVGAACFNVPGVLNATPVYIGLSPSPASSTTLVMSARQLAVYDTSRIVVNSSAVTP